MKNRKIGINWFDFRIDDKYKKKFKSTLVVNFKGKLLFTSSTQEE